LFYTDKMMLRITTILTGILRSKIELVDTPDAIQYAREADAGDDKKNGKRYVTTNIASRYQAKSW